MKYITEILAVCLFTVLFVAGAVAQVNPVYQRMLKNGWRYPFGNGFRKLAPAQLDAEACSSMGYDDTTVANLRKLNVDILGRWKTHDWDEKMWTALSDCIVTGTVSRIEHPSWPRPWFHTVAYVQVEQFLRNDYGLPKGEVAVVEVSGPTGRSGERVINIGEDTLSVGEHVLLFLGASSLITFASDNNMRDLYNHLINDPMISFELLAKYDIKSGAVFFKGRKESPSNVQEDVTTILNVIDRSLPTGK